METIKSYIVRWEYLAYTGEWREAEQKLGALDEARELVSNIRLDNNLRLNPAHRSIRLYEVVETEREVAP